MNEIIRIPNIENYTIEIINGELIATPKMLFITERELINIDLAHSTIKKCIIKRGVEIISIDKIYYKKTGPCGPVFEDFNNPIFS